MKKKILLAEDDILVAKTLERLLKAEGYDVVLARNGEEVLGLLKEKNFDLVISDIRMPKLDGIKALGELRHREGTEEKTTPVILMTGYANEEAPIDALKWGVVDYVLKPFNNDQLLASVKKATKEKLRITSDLVSLLKEARQLINQYQSLHTKEIFEDEDRKNFLNSISNIVFLMEKKAATQD